MSAVLKIKYKDGDDDGIGMLESVLIKAVNNGYIVVWEHDDGVVEEVYIDKESLLLALEGEL